MRETEFIDQNKEKWKRLEALDASKEKDPEQLGDLFVEVTNDLSFAKSFFANRSIRVYLNNLSLKVHSSVYKSRIGLGGPIKDLWLRTIPKVYREARWSVLLATLLFFGSVAVGVLSSQQDPGFIGVMLPQSYIDMTLDNIANDDPMAVYKNMGEMDMFTYITFNNIFVAFRVFLLGALFMIGTVAAMLFEGARLGAFHFLFYENGYLQESLLTVWMHGTPEISGIILAAAAGLELGRGLVFPGTYQRKESFLIGARRGIIMMLGLIPVFIFAGFIEGFATRYTEMHDYVRLTFILSCGAFILYYFIIMPWRKFRHLDKDPLVEQRVPEFPTHDFKMKDVKKHGQILANTFSRFSSTLAEISLPLLGLCSAYVILLFMVRKVDGHLFDGVMAMNTGNPFTDAISRSFQQVTQLYDFGSEPLLFLLNTVFMVILVLFSLKKLTSIPELANLDVRPKKILLPVLGLVASAHAFFWLPVPLSLFLFLFCAPFGLITLGSKALIKEERPGLSALVSRAYGLMLGLVLVLFFTGVLFMIFFNSGITDYLLSQVLMNFFRDEQSFNLVMMGSSYLFAMFTLGIIVLLNIYASIFVVISCREKVSAENLKNAISEIGVRNKAYGMLRE